MASEYAMELLNYQSIKSKLNFLSKEKTKDNELIEDLKEELEKLRLSIKNKQTDQQSPDEWNIGDDLYESAIIKMFHTKAAYGGVITDAEWMDLRQLVNLYMPNFMEYIESFDYPFSLKQTNVLILTKLRFSPSELCNILQMNPSSVSNMRKRMYQKMFHKEGGAIDFDNVIRQAPC
jgi:hypothetical protein